MHSLHTYLVRNKVGPVFGLGGVPDFPRELGQNWPFLPGRASGEHGLDLVGQIGRGRKSSRHEVVHLMIACVCVCNVHVFTGPSPNPSHTYAYVRTYILPYQSYIHT